MPLHSPLAAVLAGVELTLRKAQDWEQHAHRGVSLKGELGPLSALVVRWRVLELESWPKLLDAREQAFVSKVIKTVVRLKTRCLALALLTDERTGWQGCGHEVIGVHNKVDVVIGFQ